MEKIWQKDDSDEFSPSISITDDGRVCIEVGGKQIITPIEQWHIIGGANKSCVWKYDDEYDYFDTTCGGTFSLMDGSLDDNDYVFCPKCGGYIIQEYS